MTFQNAGPDASTLLVAGVTLSQLPEPMSLSLLGCGIAGLAPVRRLVTMRRPWAKGRSDPSAAPGPRVP